MRLQPIPQPRRAATQVQHQPSGTVNMAAPGTRPLPSPSYQKQSAAFAREHFYSTMTVAQLAAGLNRLQDKTALVIEALRLLPFVNGNLIQGVQFTAATPLGVQHYLGQTWAGYWVQSVSVAGCTFYAVPTPGSDSTSIQLVPSATCQADVWVFC